MDKNSLDFLDQLIPSASNDAPPAVQSTPQNGPRSKSLAPPPASVLAAARQGVLDNVQAPPSSFEHDIDVEVNESAPHHDVPDAKTAVQDLMPWQNDEQRSPSSRPARRVPLPEETARPTGSSSSSSSSLPAVQRSAPPPPPSKRASKPAEPGAELFADLAPPRRSARPAPPSVNPPAPATLAAASTAESAEEHGEITDAYDFADADAEHSDAEAAPLPEPELATSPLSSPLPQVPPPVVVSPNVWSVDSILPEEPSSLAASPASSAPAPPRAALSASLPPLPPPPPPSLAPPALAPPSFAPPASALAPNPLAPPPPSLAPPQALPPAPSSLPPPLDAGFHAAEPAAPFGGGAASHAGGYAVDAGAAEWDEAPTAIYARDSLHSAPAPRAQLPKLTLPPMPTVPAMRAPRRTAVVAGVLQEQLMRHKRWIIPAAAAVLLGLIVLVIPKGEERGALVVNIAGPAGVAVDGVKVYLDEALACEDSPCQLERLEARGHVVTAEAPGYVRAAATAVLVKAGETVIHNMELLREKSGTGVAIPDSPGNLTLFVNGKEIGKLPQRLDDLSPGEHVLRLTGEGLRSVERRVTLQEGQLLALEPFKLPVSQGALRISAGENADGAEVTLNGKSVTLPLVAEVDGSVAHVVRATKAGFDPVELQVKFADGQPEREVTVALEPAAEGTVSEESASDKTVQVARAPAQRSAVTQARARADKPATKPKAAAAGTGKLTLLSVPPAVVILDGRPIGKSPKRAITVSAGTHTVVFVHPTKGRKRASAKVAAGGSKTVAVKF